MNRLRLFSFLLVLILSPLIFPACVATYSHPSKAPSRFESDEAECQRIAQRIAAKKQASGQGCSVCEEIDRCLKMKGWKRE